MHLDYVNMWTMVLMVGKRVLSMRCRMGPNPPPAATDLKNDSRTTSLTPRYGHACNVPHTPFHETRKGSKQGSINHGGP